MRQQRTQPDAAEGIAVVPERKREAAGARARNAVEDLKWRAPTRSAGLARPFKPQTGTHRRARGFGVKPGIS
jgi:hypothetical protein